MSMIPFIVWACVILVGLIIYIGISKRIEKSGLARLGATGNLFTCNPDVDKEKGAE